MHLIYIIDPSIVVNGPDRNMGGMDVITSTSLSGVIRHDCSRSWDCIN